MDRKKNKLSDNGEMILQYMTVWNIIHYALWLIIDKCFPVPDIS